MGDFYLFFFPILLGSFYKYTLGTQTAFRAYFDVINTSFEYYYVKIAPVLFFYTRLFFFN